MDSLLANNKPVVPGFRFYPTDEELFIFYLKRKVMGKSLKPQMIAELDVYRFDPWDLPSKSLLQTRDLNWFFFCPRSKKYANGARTNRSTEHGYWKSTGNDRTVNYRHRPVGKIKTLIFHQGKPPHGERTDWVMHEYRLEDNDLADKGIAQDAFVVCKVYRKSGLGPKNGEHYGAPFVEEDWDSDDDDDNVETSGGCVLHSQETGGGHVLQPEETSGGHVLQPEETSGGRVLSPEETGPVMNAENAAADQSVAVTAVTAVTVVCDETAPDELDRMLSAFTADEDWTNGIGEMDNDIFSDLGDLADIYFPNVSDSAWTDVLRDGYMELNDLQ